MDQTKLSAAIGTIYIALVGTKGGITKTSTVVNLAGLYAGLGLRVLMVDADPQGSCSKYYELNQASPEGFLELLHSGVAKKTQISHTVIPRLDVIRANFKPTDVAWFQSHMRRDVHLKHALRTQVVTDNYDLVLIDSQGAEGALQEAAALAADDVISPIMPHVINTREFFAGTIELFNRLRISREPVGRVHVLISGAKDTVISRGIVDDLRNTSIQSEIGRIGVLSTIIPDMASVNEAQAIRAPLHLHDCYRKNKRPCGAEYLHAIAGELTPFVRGRFAEGMPHETWPADSPARICLPESQLSQLDP